MSHLAGPLPSDNQTNKRKKPAYRKGSSVAYCNAGKGASYNGWVDGGDERRWSGSRNQLEGYADADAVR